MMAAGPGAPRGGGPVSVVLWLGLLGAVLGTAQAAVYFQEQFLDGGCGKREGGCDEVVVSKGSVRGLRGGRE